MDLVRLVLERAKTAREAVTVCSDLLEEFGQGGGCAEDDDTWCYENSFLFADRNDAWVLETAGTFQSGPSLGDREEGDELSGKLRVAVKFAAYLCMIVKSVDSNFKISK